MARRRSRPLRLTAGLAAPALALVLAAGCDDGDGNSDGGAAGASPAKAADPVVERLSAACGAYRDGLRTTLPPTRPEGYPAYAREEVRRVEGFIAELRKVTGPPERRGRPLAAASQLLETFNTAERTTHGEYFLNGAYGFADRLRYAEEELDTAMRRLRIRCGTPARAPSAELRAFHRDAAAVCEASGKADGTPGKDARLLRRRVEGHAELGLPGDATAFEREALAAQRRASGIAAKKRRARRLADRDRTYVAVANRMAVAWSRVGVVACAELPQGDWEE